MILSSKKRAESPERHACWQARSRRSMTLIELLISLAIIGVMTGIAFPLFSYYQKRSLVDTDIKNFVQLFNYARALQNNPDNVSRISDQTQDYHYVIKFINTGGVNRAQLYSTADPTYIVDKVDFSEDISIIDQDGNSAAGNNLTLTLSGTPPKETLVCSTPCETKISLGLTSKGGSQVTKIAEILNTKGQQLLSVSIK